MHNSDNPTPRPLVYLTIEQATERGQFCRNTIKKAMRTGELRHMRFGRLIRIKVEDFDQWMAGKIVGTPRVQTGSEVATPDFQVIEKTVGAKR